MNWIPIKKELPPENKEVLARDRDIIFVGTCFVCNSFIDDKKHLAWLASNPNKLLGHAPYLVAANPTHWCLIEPIGHEY